MRWTWCVAVVLLTPLAVVFQTAPAGSKVLGPNGEIAFSRFDPNLGDTTTVVVNPDGSGQQTIFPGQVTGQPHWSPNGTLLAFLTPDDNPCPPCAASTVVLNPDTGVSRVLPPPDPKNLSSECSIWSPDGKRFACEVESNDGSRNGMYTVRTSDGRGLRQITSNPGGNDVPIDYSPNGEQIVFGRLGQDHACTTKAALYVVNIDGSGLQQITPPGFCDDDGSWSPDGSKIVFEHFGSLYTVHPDGTHLVKIPLKTGSATTSFSAFDASWSPDGTKIAFSLRTKAGTGSSAAEGIGTANADGSDVQMITVSPSGDDSKVDWGPHPLAP
jgi:Tol biopolymer transport system component